MTHKTLIIAQWEFRVAVFRRAYIIAVLAMPVLFLGLGALTVLTTPSAIRSAGARPIAVVDKAGVLDVQVATDQAARREQLRTSDAFSNLPQNIAGTGGLETYEEETRAVSELAAGHASAVYVIEADYMTTGNITAYTRDVTVLGQAAAGQRQTQVADAIRASLLRKVLPQNVLDRAYAPAIRIKRLTVDSKGEIRNDTNAFSPGRFAGTFGVFVLLTMAIFFSAGFLQQATIEDRQNRVFEVLLSSVDADDLILGKIIGLGGAGLLQVGIYIVIILALGSTALSYVEISAGQLALALVYFAIGYLIFASLMAAVGMIARSAQESAQLSAIWTFASIAPMFFITSIATSPNGTISRILSFFPLSSPVTMLLRLTTTPEVPTLDVVVSIVIGVVSVYAALKGTVRIFRAATLMYGKRPSLPELIHWLKAGT